MGEVKEEVSQPLPEKGSTAEGQEGKVGQGEEVPPTEEAPQSLPEKGSKAEGAEKVAFKWEPIVSSLGGPPRPRVSKRSVSVVDRTSFQEGGAQVPPDRFVQRPGNPVGKMMGTKCVDLLLAQSNLHRFHKKSLRSAM